MEIDDSIDNSMFGRCRFYQEFDCNYCGQECCPENHNVRETNMQTQKKQAS